MKAKIMGEETGCEVKVFLVVVATKDNVDEMILNISDIKHFLRLPDDLEMINGEEFDVDDVKKINDIIREKRVKKV